MTEHDMVEREKYCEVYDAHNDFTRDLNRALGPNAEAILSRLWDKHYAGTKSERRLVIRKWDRITISAKARMLEDVNRETTLQVRS